MNDINKMLDRNFRSIALSVVRVIYFAQKTTGRFIGHSRGRTTY